MQALDAGIAESLSDKLALGYSDNPKVAGLGFPRDTLPVVTTVVHGCYPYKTSP